MTGTDPGGGAGTRATGRFAAALRAELGRRYRGLDKSAAGLVALWTLFALLVLLKIHGSSLPFVTIAGKDLVGNAATPTYVMSPVAQLLGIADEPLGTQPAARGLLQMQPRQIRVDEWGVWTQWALAQFSHDPPFPVVNTNIGGGQLMLLAPNSPVWHPTTIARPSSWGYLALGRDRGVAWAWWFPLAACFTVLYLLMLRMLDGNRRLAAFGAFWYCGSAYVVCWSLWPAYSTFFAGLLTLAGYHLLTSRHTLVQVVCAVLLAIGLPGYLMCSYPPWQVPLGWLAIALLAGLLWRDRSTRWWARRWRVKAPLLALALTGAALLAYSYVAAALPAMQALLGTVYPGSRFHGGGDYEFSWLLRGYYNFWTSYVHANGFFNASEAASFLHLFPAILVALCLSSRLRRGLGAIGWILVGYLGFLLWYCLIGLPHWLAAVTMMSRSHPPRADIALGLCSIMLCMWFLHRFATAAAVDAQQPQTRASLAPTDWERRVPLVAASLVAVVVLAHGLLMKQTTGSYPHAAVAILAAALVGGVSYALLRRWQRAFCSGTAAAVILTGGFFNPLSIGTDYVYSGELVRVKRLDEAAPQPPLWVCYEPREMLSLCGALINQGGGRSLSGIHQYPHLALWRHFDPERRSERAYNRYAHVQLEPCVETDCLEFVEPGDAYWHSSKLPPNVFVLKIAPTHERLRSLGARYVVAVGPMQDEEAFTELSQTYRAPSGGFTIFELPPDA